MKRIFILNGCAVEEDSIRLNSEEIETKKTEMKKGSSRVRTLVPLVTRLGSGATVDSSLKSSSKKSPVKKQSCNKSPEEKSNQVPTVTEDKMPTTVQIGHFIINIFHVLFNVYFFALCLILCIYILCFLLCLIQ